MKEHLYLLIGFVAVGFGGIGFFMGMIVASISSARRDAEAAEIAAENLPPKFPDEF